MSTILAVDDDEKIRGLLSTVLRRKGHRVFTADHGQKAIDVFRRERPHVTILDFEMPDMDGIAVLKKIREIAPCAPVIMLTGAGTDAREKQARELGVADFLAKGFSLHELGMALNQVLKQPSLDTGESPPSQRLTGRARESA